MKATPTARTLSLLHALLGGLAVVYVLQIYSPLRLNTDVIAYLAKAAALVDGRPPPYADWVLPPGYQFLVAALDALGIASSWTFVALNCFFLATGLVAGYGLLRDSLELRPVAATVVCSMVLLSFLTVKHVSLAVPDTSFFATVFGSLWAMQRARHAAGSKRWRFYALAIILIATSISLRLIGIALIPALGWSLWGAYRASSNQRRGQEKVGIWVVVLSALVLVVVALAIVMESFYLDQLYYIYRDHGVTNNLRFVILVRMTEWGEIFLNIPESQLPSAFRWPLRFLGLAAMGVAGWGLFLRRRSWSECEIYFISYLAVLLIYTGHATRYWIPVLPLILGWAAVAVSSIIRTAWRRRALYVYLAGYAVVGLAGLAYSTFIPFSGSNFPERYGGGSLSRIYQAAFDGERDRPGQPAGGEVETAVDVLYRYEPRTRR